MNPLSWQSEFSKNLFSAQTFRTFCPKIFRSTSQRCATTSARSSKHWRSCTSTISSTGTSGRRQFTSRAQAASVSEISVLTKEYEILFQVLRRATKSTQSLSEGLFQIVEQYFYFDLLPYLQSFKGAILFYWVFDCSKNVPLKSRLWKIASLIKRANHLAELVLFKSVG